MTTEPFTPHADSIQTAWVLMCQQSRISTQPPVEELEAEFDRFLAHVRREAKAEAWDEAHEVGWNNADEYWRCDGLVPSYSKADTYPNPYRQEQNNE